MLDKIAAVANIISLIILIVIGIITCNRYFESKEYIDNVKECINNVKKCVNECEEELYSRDATHTNLGKYIECSSSCKFSLKNCRK